MPRNKGKRVSTRGRASSDEKRTTSPVKEDDQEYMKVTKTLGNCKMELEDQSGNIFLGTIRGTMRKRVYVKVGDLVIVSVREFQTSKVDIIHRCGYSEISYLVRKQEIESDFVDIDTMFSESTTTSNKRSKDSEIDWPSDSDSESDSIVEPIKHAEHTESSGSESELDFNDI